MIVIKIVIARRTETGIGTATATRTGIEITVVIETAIGTVIVIGTGIGIEIAIETGTGIGIVIETATGTAVVPKGIKIEKGAEVETDIRTNAAARVALEAAVEAGSLKIEMAPSHYWTKWSVQQPRLQLGP